MHDTSWDVIHQPPAAPARSADGHKGTFGTVVVVGGCATMIGAPAMAARAACRSGVGLVKIAAPADVLPFALTIEPGATGIAWDAGTLPDAVNDATVLAVGPGLGTQRDEHVSACLASDCPVVLDADGLNALARAGKRIQRDSPWILTPHPGEFGRLARALGIMSQTDQPSADHARTLARAHRAVVVLKGHRTVVTDGQRLYTNHTGNVAMATAGTGDVLTGVIAALWAGGMSDFDAAVLGVHVHGLAGDDWADQHGHAGLRAQDLADGLPRALRKRQAQTPNELR